MKVFSYIVLILINLHCLLIALFQKSWWAHSPYERSRLGDILEYELWIGVIIFFILAFWKFNSWQNKFYSLLLITMLNLVVLTGITFVVIPFYLG